MDVYRKFLVELYKATDGNTNETVNFLELVKNAGFYSSYKDILKELAYRSWIYEDKDDKVKLTHWGADEAKKWLSRAPDADQNLAKNVNRLSAETQEFTEYVKKFADNVKPEKLGELEKRAGKISKIIEELKTDF